MNIDVVLERSDYLALVKSVIQEPKSLIQRVRVLFLWAGAGVLIALTFRLLDFRLGVVSAAVTMAIFLPLFFAILARMHRKLLPSREGAILGYHSYEISEEGIVDRSRHMTTDIKWPAVREAKEGERHFFLMVDNCVALIVPKRVFSSESRQEEFREFISRGKV